MSFSLVQTSGQHGTQPVVVAQFLAAGDDVLALAIELEIEIQLPRAGGRIAGEADAGAGRAAGIAEYHGLHRDRGAGVVADAVHPPVAGGFRRVPRPKDRLGRGGELLMRIGGKCLPGQRPVAIQHRQGQRPQVAMVQLAFGVRLGPRQRVATSASNGAVGRFATTSA